MELKLFQLESDSDDLYYGIELQESNNIFRGHLFYFMRIPSIRAYMEPVIEKTPSKDKKDEIKQDVFSQIRELLIELSPEFNYISVQNFTTISVEEFNPTGFYKEDYQKVRNAIKSDELRDKLMELADNSPSIGKADITR